MMNKLFWMYRPLTTVFDNEPGDDKVEMTKAKKTSLMS